MALSGLDIYKLLPKTNCRDCGFVTCLAFAMQIAKKTVSLESCPHLSREAKNILELQNQPAIKMVATGQAGRELKVGNETVLFRHEEKFYNPCGIGFILGSDAPVETLKASIRAVDKLAFERVGQKLYPDIIAVRQGLDREGFINAVKLVYANTSMAMMLMSKDTAALREALKITAGRRPVLYAADALNYEAMGALAKEFDSPLVAAAGDLSAVSDIADKLSSAGVQELLLDTGSKPVGDKLWDLTQIRRQPLKKNNRSLGYPAIVLVDEGCPFSQLAYAATAVAKYAGIVLLEDFSRWLALSLLTFRQNIYSDPQKPLQIEPKLYPVGKVTARSPVLITTNFSLSYYTVLAEVESSKIPGYILSVDTEGMSVLTAWAAEKFTPQRITQSVDHAGLAGIVNHKRLIIPGYVAVISGELEEKSGWEVIVGPKEASGIPAFLKNIDA